MAFSDNVSAGATNFIDFSDVINGRLFHSCQPSNEYVVKSMPYRKNEGIGEDFAEKMRE